MTGVAGHEGRSSFQVVVGVDTHQDKHVAVAIDQHGVRLGEFHTPTTTRGYQNLERWSLGLGAVQAFGIEGTGSYGAGVARFLSGRGFTVVEVNRPDRATRYRKGKSDPTDAESAARSVLAGVARRHSQVGRGRGGDDPHAQGCQGLGSQGAHPGLQPDESSDCHLPGPAAGVPQREHHCCLGFRLQGLSARRSGQPHRSGQACPFVPWPAATINSAMRSRTWRPSSKSSPAK